MYYFHYYLIRSWIADNGTNEDRKYEEKITPSSSVSEPMIGYAQRFVAAAIRIFNGNVDFFYGFG